MKKNDRRIDRVYSFFNAIRGNNTPNEYQSVLAVLKKVMVLQDCAQNEMDYDELYQLMESVAIDFPYAIWNHLPLNIFVCQTNSQ